MNLLGTGQKMILLPDLPKKMMKKLGTSILMTAITTTTQFDLSDFPEILGKPRIFFPVGDSDGGSAIFNDP